MDCVNDGNKRNCALDTKAMESFGRKLFDLGWGKTFDDDLALMNENKIGHPFMFSSAFISWALLLRTALGISYRLTLGMVNSLLELHDQPNISLTQLYTRCTEQAMNIDTNERFLMFGTGRIEPKGHEITVALDATGISLNKYGGWLMHKWNLDRTSGWIKLHVAVDVDTNEILAFVITDETVGDITCTDKLMELVVAAGHDVGKLLADAGYDSKDNWRRYTNMKMHVCINIRSSQLTERAMGTGNLEIRSYGCVARGNQMRRIREIGRDEWKKENGYGMRWKVECTFSDLKRFLSDILRAKTKRNCVLETQNMVLVHNEYKAIRAKYAET